MNSRILPPTPLCQVISFPSKEREKEDNTKEHVEETLPTLYNNKERA